VFSGIFLAAFLKFHIHYNISKALNFSSLLFYFSIFMEESYSIPKTIGKNKVYMIGTILWLLTAIVLTNIYVSHVISGLNAPLTGERLKNIEDLHTNFSNKTPRDILKFYDYSLINVMHQNFSKLSSGRIKSAFEKIHRKQRLTAGFTLLSEPLILSYPKDIWILT